MEGLRVMKGLVVTGDRRSELHLFENIFFTGLSRRESVIKRLLREAPNSVSTSAMTTRLVGCGSIGFG